MTTAEIWEKATAHAESLRAIAEVMVCAQTLPEFNDALNSMASVVEMASEQTSFASMEDLGYRQTGPDTWHRKTKSTSQIVADGKELLRATDHGWEVVREPKGFVNPNTLEDID